MSPRRARRGGGGSRSGPAAGRPGPGPSGARRPAPPPGTCRSRAAGPAPAPRRWRAGAMPCPHRPSGGRRGRAPAVPGRRGPPAGRRRPRRAGSAPPRDRWTGPGGGPAPGGRGPGPAGAGPRRGAGRDRGAPPEGPRRRGAPAPRRRAGRARAGPPRSDPWPRWHPRRARSGRRGRPGPSCPVPVPHRRGPPPAGRRGPPGRSGLELLQLTDPSDEGVGVGGDEAGRERDRGADDALPGDLDHVHRVREALELHRAPVEVALGPTSAGDGLHHVGGQDLVAVGEGAQPRRLDHRFAEAVVALQAHVPGGQAGADGQLRLAALAVEAVDRLLGGPRRRHCVAPGPEGGHEPVAEALDHPSPVRLDGRAQQCVVGSPGLVVGGAELDRQPRRVDEVGEEEGRRGAARGHVVSLSGGPRSGSPRPSVRPEAEQPSS